MGRIPCLQREWNENGAIALECYTCGVDTVVRNSAESQGMEMLVFPRTNCLVYDSTGELLFETVLRGGIRDTILPTLPRE